MAKLRLPSCRFCGQSFRPDPRVGSKQYTCPEPACQAMRHQGNRSAWSRAHPEYGRDQYSKKQSWFEAHPGYHAELRKRSPELAERHRLRERARRQRRREEQMALQEAIRIQEAVAKDLASESGSVAQPDSILIQLSIGHHIAGDVPRVAQPEPMDSNILAAYNRFRAIHRLACRVRRRRHG